MNTLRKAITLVFWSSLIGCGLTQTAVAESWEPQQHIDSFSFGGSIEGNSKDVYFGYTRYKQDGIGIGVEAAVYRYDHENDALNYSSTYTERDLSVTLPIAATEKIYVTPAVGVRQIKDAYEFDKAEFDDTQYEALYGLDLTYMLDNVSITVGADKSKSSDWSITYGLGVSF